MDKMEEMILVLRKEALKELIESKEFPEVGVFNLNGDPQSSEILFEFLNTKWDNYGTVIMRGLAEEDLELVQPIPYTVLKRGDEVFAYTRLIESGEERLHGKTSIGVGGHMNTVEDPWNFQHITAVNNARELFEEVFIVNDSGRVLTPKMVYDLAKKAELEGLIYNELTPVDSVHLGLLMVIELPKEYEVSVGEVESLKGEFVKISELENYNLENWTKSALRVLQ